MKIHSTTTGAKNSPAGFNAKRHLRILKALVIATNFFVFFMYASLFFMFADTPFVLMDELKMIANSMAWATGFGVGFSFLIFAGDGLTYLIQNRKRVKYPNLKTPPAIHNYPAATPLLINRPAGSMLDPEFSNN